MSTVTDAARDPRTMLRRNLRRMVRCPSLTLFLIGGPNHLPANWTVDCPPCRVSKVNLHSRIAM
jgi:hypothetical protein